MKNQVTREMIAGLMELGMSYEAAVLAVVEGTL